MPITKNFNCPGCGKFYNYKIPEPVSICCSGCTNTYSIDKQGTVKDEEDKFIIPKEVSVLKIGVKGIYENISFEIIGRIRSVNNFSISNEWVIWFEKSNAYKWLIESGGTYFVFEPIGSALDPILVKGKKAGATIVIDKEKYILTEISKQHKFYMEGEIPENSFNPDSFFKLELTKTDNSKFASVCVFEKDNVEIAYGKIISVTQLNLSVANEYKDWI